jgi:hypothetical protein
MYEKFGSDHKNKIKKDEGWFEYCIHHIQEMNQYVVIAT